MAEHVRRRSEHAFTALDPAANPYLQWIGTGRHLTALPLALRAEHFDIIRGNLDRLEWGCQSVEDFLASSDAPAADRFNLSNIFEYMSEANYYALLERLVRHARPGARLAYWNMLVPRTRPASMADRLEPLTDLSARLFAEEGIPVFDADRAVHDIYANPVGLERDIEALFPGCLVDGSVSDPIPVQEAHRRGARRIVVIRSRPAHAIKRDGPVDALAATLLRDQPGVAQALRTTARRYRDAVTFLRRPPPDTKIVHIAPPQPLASGRTTQDVGALRRDYALGLSLAQRYGAEIRALLHEPAQLTHARSA